MRRKNRLNVDSGNAFSKQDTPDPWIIAVEMSMHFYVAYLGIGHQYFYTQNSKLCVKYLWKSCNLPDFNSISVYRIVSLTYRIKRSKYYKFQIHRKIKQKESVPNTVLGVCSRGFSMCTCGIDLEANWVEGCVAVYCTQKAPKRLQKGVCRRLWIH